MKYILHFSIVLVSKASILAILAYLLTLLTILPFYVSVLIMYHFHLLAFLFIRQYDAIIVSLSYAAKRGRLFIY